MRVITVAVVASLVGLVGCSDGTSFGSSASSGGKVVDGYLAGALVCADENLNRACDEGEPSTITDANGNFRLTGLDRRQRAVPLVMEVDFPNTIDLDTNTPAPAGLKYYAPAGSRVISALSTLIQAKIEQEIAEALANNQPVPSLKKLKAEAIADVADDLDLDGVNLLSYDPVALKNNERLSDNVRLTAAKVHVINQVLSEQIADLLPTAEGLVPGEEDAAFAVVISKLDPSDVADAVALDLAGSTLEDFLTTPALYTAVTSETAPAAPTAGEINDQVLADAVIREALNNLLPNPAPTEPTGGTGGSGV